MRLRRPAAIAALSVALVACGDAGPMRRPPPAAPPAAPPVDARLGELLARLETDGPAERRATRQALIEIGPPAVPALLARLEHPEFGVRWKAVNVLGYIEDRRALGPLVERAVLDDNPHVRWRALWALAAHDADEEVVEALLRRTDDEAQRWNAAVGLSFFAHPDATPILLEGATGDEPWRRFEALFGLRRAHDATTSARLRALVDHPDPRTRQELALTLGRIGDAAAVDGLRALLDDEAPQVRWRAAMGLRSNGSTGALVSLRARLERETDETVRKHLLEAIEALSRR